MEKTHGTKTQVRCSEEARTRGRAEWKGERDAEIKEQIVLRVGHAGSWRTNREEITQTTVCIRNDGATRDTERQARVGATMNQQAQELNERVKSPESLITENQKRTESRMNQTQEAIPTDTPDAAEYISDVQTVFDESPSGCQREVQIGHVEDQLMNGKTKE